MTPLARRVLARAAQIRRPLSTRADGGLRARVSNVTTPPPGGPPAPASAADTTGQGQELAVGEMDGAKFKIEPVRRVGEDERTMRARLVYQSRKRGTLESDLLLSTFADAHLPRMSKEQMTQYDRFLDENDWDIYYWATQGEQASASASSSASSSSSPSSPSSPSPPANTPSGQDLPAKSWKPTSPFASAPRDYVEVQEVHKNAAATAAAASAEPYSQPGEGEWAQTVGTFKPSYRPVPKRWQGSEVLQLLRDHVKRRSKGGAEGGGMGFMPALRTGV